MSAFGVFLVRIFTHSDWIRRDTEYLSVFSPNAGKYGPEKLRIGTLFTQCITHSSDSLPVRSYMYGVFCLRERLRFYRKAHLSWLKSHLVSIYISVIELILNFKILNGHCCFRIFKPNDENAGRDDVHGDKMKAILDNNSGLQFERNKTLQVFLSYKWNKNS